MSNATKELIDKVNKSEEDVKNLRQEQRRTPIPYARVFKTPKNNPDEERKISKKIRQRIMRGDYE